jgi:hypothetical protein
MPGPAPGGLRTGTRESVAKALAPSFTCQRRMLQSDSPRSETRDLTAAFVLDTADRIRKRGMAIATWYEAEPHVQVSGTDCALLVRGNTARMKTHLFSRIVRGLILPNYEVATFFYEVPDPLHFSPYTLGQTEEAILSYMQHYEIRWSFVYFVSEGRFSSEAANWARRYRRKEIGVVLVDAKSQQLEFAPDMMLSRHAAKFIRFPRN